MASSRRSDCEGDPQRDATRKEGEGSHSTTKKANYWESNKGRPAETINMKLSGEVNLFFCKLKLFPIRFPVDKVKKKRTEKLPFVGS